MNNLSGKSSNGFCVKNKIIINYNRQKIKRLDDKSRILQKKLGKKIEKNLEGKGKRV